MWRTGVAKPQPTLIDRAGRLLIETLPNGVTKTYSYDDAGHLLSLVNSHGVELLSSFIYTYDENGNRLTATENVKRPVDADLDLLFADGFESGDFANWGGSGPYNASDLLVTNTAAISGTYGMQVAINNSLGAYAVDLTPNLEARFRTRFYFDVNSLNMANNDSFTIFLAVSASNQSVANIDLRKSVGDYPVRAGITNDAVGWSYTPWVTISDDPHAFSWIGGPQPVREPMMAALHSGWMASSGAATPILTMTHEGSKVPDMVRSAEWIPTPTAHSISISVESHQQNYIGLAPGVSVDPAPVKPDSVFVDGFESGDLAAWSLSATDGGDLRVSASAAISGTHGLEAVINNNTAIYVTDWSPSEETRYRARFYFDPNSIGMANNDAHYIFQAYNRDAAYFAQVELRFSVGDYQIRGQCAS